MTSSELVELSSVPSGVERLSKPTSKDHNTLRNQISFSQLLLSSSPFKSSKSSSQSRGSHFFSMCALGDDQISSRRRSAKINMYHEGTDSSRRWIVSSLVDINESMTDVENDIFDSYEKPEDDSIIDNDTFNSDEECQDDMSDIMALVDNDAFVSDEDCQDDIRATVTPVDNESFVSDKEYQDDMSDFMIFLSLKFQSSGTNSIGYA